MKKLNFFITGLFFSSLYLAIADMEVKQDTAVYEQMHKDNEKPKKHKKKTGQYVKALDLPGLTATKTAAVVGGGNPVPGSIFEYTMLLTNNGTLDLEGVTYAETLDPNLTLVPGSVTATPIAIEDSYTSIGNVGIIVTAAGGLLINDISPDGTTLSLTAQTNAATADGGVVTINTDGSFNYTPKTGTTASSDSFTYTLNSSSGSSTATVTIEIDGMLWFIDSSVDANGNGSPASPFKNWSDFAMSNTGALLQPKPGHTIFLAPGSYSGTVTLLDGQKILGAGSTESLASFASITVPTYSKPLPPVNLTAPSIANITSVNALNLAMNNSLKGLNFGNNGTDINGANFGTLTLSEINLIGDGRALNLNTGTLNGSVNDLTSVNSTSEGVNLQGVDGTFVVNNATTITNPASNGIRISGSSSIDINFKNTTITGSGATGLFNSSSSTSHICTFNDLDISPDNAFMAIDSRNLGRFNVSSGTIITTGANGCYIGGSSTTNKGTLNLVFDSFSASNGTRGLEIEYATGTLTVNGSGTTNNTGGTISNMTNAAVRINDATGINLKNIGITNGNTLSGHSDPSNYQVSTTTGAVNLLNSQNIILTNIDISGVTRQRGINAYNITNLTLNGGSVITDCGDEVYEGNFYAQDLKGTCNVSDVTMTRGADEIMRVLNNSGTLTLNIGEVGKTTTLQNTQQQNANMVSPNGLSATGNYCFIFINGSSATGTTTINTRNTTFSQARTHAFRVVASGTATVNANVKDCIMANTNNAAGIAGEDAMGDIEMVSENSATLNYNVLGNTCSGKGTHLFNFVANNSSKQEGRILNNTLTHNGTDSNFPSGAGIRSAAQDAAQIISAIENNTVNGVPFEDGIRVSSQGGTSKNDANIISNTVNKLDVSGHNFSIGAGSSGLTTTDITCVNIRNNTANRPGNINGAILRTRAVGTARINLQGNGSNSPTTASEQIWVANLNSALPGAGYVSQSGTFGTNIFTSSSGGPAACLTPSNPTFSVNALPMIAKAEEIIPEEIISETLQTADANLQIDTAIAEVESMELPLTAQEHAEAEIETIAAGENVSVGPFSLPKDKFTTIKFRATVSSSPSNCDIPSQGSVSGSNFATVLTDDPAVSGSDNPTIVSLIVPPINTGSTISSSTVCFGGSVTLDASCPSGSNLKWFTEATGGSEVSTSNTYSPSNITANTSYYASCTIGSCESARTLVGSVTVLALPIVNISAPSAVCVNGTVDLSVAAGATTYTWSGPGIVATNSDITTAVPTITGDATYKVVVTNSFGCVDSSEATVTVYPKPSITLGTIDPICIGARSFIIPYTGSTFLPTTYSISGTGITTVTDGNLEANEILVDLSAPASGTSIAFKLTVKNENSCVSDTIDSQVVVNIKPSMVLAPIPSICEGATSFEIPFTSTSNNPVSYSISGDELINQADVTLGSSPILVSLSSPATTGSVLFTLSLKNSLGCSSDFINGNVTVNSNPIASASNNGPVCSGNELELSADGGVSYSWSGPNAYSNTGSPVTISNVTLAEAGTYTVTVTDANGCTATAVTEVIVNQTPTPVIDASTPVCVGDTIFISTTSDGTYSWSGPNGFESTQKSDTILLATADNAGTYSLTVNISGCTASSAVTVVVNELPVVSVTGSGLYCEASDVPLAANSATATSYSWTGPNNFQSSLQNPVISSFESVDVGTYIVTVTDANACSTKDSVIINYKPLPDFSILGQTTYCEGDTVLVYAQINNSNSGDTLNYSWTGPNNFMSSNYQIGVIEAPVSFSGKYFVTVTMNSCSVLDSVDIQILAKPAAPSAEVQHVCINGNITLQATCPSGSNIVWYNTLTSQTMVSNSLTNVTANTSLFAACGRDDLMGCFGPRTEVFVVIDTAITYSTMEAQYNNLYLCQNGDGFITTNSSLSGNNRSYQWQLNTGSGFANISNDANFNGVQKDTLFLTNIPLSFQNYQLRVLISNECGAIIGDTTTLKINILPTIQDQPLGQTVCVGNEIFFQVNASGTGLNYLWEINTGSGFVPVTGIDFSGNQTSKLTVKNIGNGLNNAQFRCKIFNTCVSIYSDAATLVVDPTVTILSQPINKSLCQGLNTSFNVVAVNITNRPLNYQWQRKLSAGWTNLNNNATYAGVNTATLNVNNTPAGLDGAEYRCLINSYCQTNVVKLNVTPVATILASPTNVSICQGNNASFSVNATGLNLTYRWQVNTGSGFVNLTDGGIYQGATSATLSLSFPDVSYNNYAYRCVVTGYSTCDLNPVNSGSATLSVGVSAEAQTIVAVSPISGNVVYQAVQAVLGLNVINPGGRAEYRAGNSILLNPGFMADTGSVFTAKIQNPCVVVNTNGSISVKPLPKEITK